MVLNCGAGEDSWHPERDQSWVFIGRTEVEAETPVLWPPDAKSWLIGKDPDVRKDWGQEEKEMTEDEMVGWHHRLSGLGFGWTPWVSDRQGGLACCGPWHHKESDTTERLSWTESLEIDNRQEIRESFYWASWCRRREQEQVTGYLAHSQRGRRPGSLCEGRVGSKGQAQGVAEVVCPLLWWCCVQGACIVPCFFSWLFKSGS